MPSIESVLTTGRPASSLRRASHAWPTYCHRRRGDARSMGHVTCAADFYESTLNGVECGASEFDAKHGRQAEVVAAADAPWPAALLHGRLRLFHGRLLLVHNWLLLLHGRQLLLRGCQLLPTIGCCCSTAGCSWSSTLDKRLLVSLLF